MVHELKSPHQPGTTRVRVLLPDRIDRAKKYPVIFLLPVEKQGENRYGDPIREVQKNNLPNRFQAIFVEPGFAQLPWYADHPTDPTIAQESHLIKMVLPLVDRYYPVNAGQRYLVGFSKSGWGAFSLILHHPDKFQKAVAWDAPLMMDKPGLYGSGPIFGTAENFRSYEVSRLLEKADSSFQKDLRLILPGYGNFRNDHIRAHALMEKLKLKHLYRDGPFRVHDWHSGWVEEGVWELFDQKENKAK